MSKNEKNLFAIPGGDPFKRQKDDLNPSVNDDIFQKCKVGGPKKKVAPTNVDDDEVFQPYNLPPPPPPKEPAVKLYNPKWSVENANFEEKVSLSFDVDLPESLKDITRVIVTVHALCQYGKREVIKSRDHYIKDGKVHGEFHLSRPAKRGDKEVDSCSYIFTAKHRDSKELESHRLPVKTNPIGNDELELELTSSDELKNGGFAFQLMAKDRSIIWKIESKNGEDKAGKLTLKFVKLNPNLEYSLDMLNSQGKIVETIFSDTPFGKWAEASK